MSEKPRQARILLDMGKADATACQVRDCSHGGRHLVAITDEKGWKFGLTVCDEHLATFPGATKVEA